MARSRWTRCQGMLFLDAYKEGDSLRARITIDRPYRYGVWECRLNGLQFAGKRTLREAKQSAERQAALIASSATLDAIQEFRLRFASAGAAVLE